MKKASLLLLLSVFVISLSLCLVACGDEHVHSFTEWTTVTNATCTQDGLQESICTCGERQTQTIAATGHHYRAWVTTTPATCTTLGEKERYCECGEKQTQKIAATGHSFGEWIIMKDPTCGETGERKHICTVCSYETTETIEKTSDHQYNEGEIISEPTCVTEGSKSMICLICNDKKTVAIPALGHNLDANGVCLRCGVRTLIMTDSQKAKAEEVYEMRHTLYEYSSEAQISINFKDKSGYYVEAPAFVEVTIIDKVGNVVYQKVLLKEASKNAVTVPYSEIINSQTSTGTLSFRVYNEGYFSFDTISKSVEKIPYTVDIELPELPQIINYSGYSGIYCSCKITEISYKVSNDDVTFYFSGEKLYDKEGNNYSRACEVGWKLYDSDGYVLKSGTMFSEKLTVGEKFKNESVTAYDCIEEGKTYRFVILNVG